MNSRPTVPFSPNPHRYMPVWFVFRNGPLVASTDEVNSQRIDFISAYCDRWCERCAFTDRCSAFACNVAIGMCGDVADGIELAVGRARSPKGVKQGTSRPLDSLSDAAPSAAEIAEFTRLERSRDTRVEESPLSRQAKAYMNQSTAWIDANRAIDDHPDVVIREGF